MKLLTNTFSCDKIEKICEKVRETNFFWPNEKVKIAMPNWSNWHDYLV